MVKKTPELAEAFQLVPMARSIPCYENNGFIQTINSKASTQDGHNPHLGILDELHAHKTRDLYDVIKSAFGARKNPLLFMITTAGYSVQGVCYEQHKLTKKILEGIVEADHYFGIIYTIDEGDDPLDPAVWIKANPNLEVSVQLDQLESYAIEAKFSPDSMAEFKTKRLNVWVTSKSPWLPMEKWKRGENEIDLEELEGVECFGGLDLAAVEDINAFGLVWKVEDRIKFWVKCYVPENVVIEKTKKGGLPYQRWVDQGYLTTTPGDVSDYAYIEKDIIEALDKFNIEAIGYDPWNATDLVNRLVDSGAPMIEYRQGPRSFNSPMKELERAIKGDFLDHGGNPVLTWMASNLVKREDVNKNMAPDRQNSEGKIDGMVAELMGLGLLLLDENTGSSIYNETSL